MTPIVKAAFEDAEATFKLSAKSKSLYSDAEQVRFSIVRISYNDSTE